jgi:organic radical activating enzyme
MPEQNSPVAPPRTVFIELTSHCNMHCEFCPSDILRRDKNHIDDSRVRGFLDQLHALGLRPPILLNVMGEPLLNKRVFEYLDLLEGEGHPVTLITNMTLLVDKSVQREILKHGNVTLALSLQTATEASYRRRGYPRLPFKDFFALIDDVAEEKFRMGSGTRLEIHIASNYVVGHDPTIQSDSPLDLWPNFSTEKSERRWIEKTLRRLESFGRRMRRTYTAAFEHEEVRTAALYKDHIGSRIAMTRAQLPPAFFRLKDNVFWGYMPIPNVFLVFKSFELWTRDEAFLRRALPSDKFTYTEENPGPWPCPMTESFGLLANGEYVLCCLDYEGEMALGNIDAVTVASILGSDRRVRIREDAMSEPLCRRCKGNLFIFDTASLDAGEQTINNFGLGFWPYEPGLHGRGGRWTKGEGWAYVYARIPARGLVIDYFSALEAEAAAELEIQSYQDEDKSFRPEKTAVFQTRPSAFGSYRTDFRFLPGRFYRIVLRSPAFVPDDDLRNGDTRRLGLAVLGLRLVGPETG